MEENKEKTFNGMATHDERNNEWKKHKQKINTPNQVKKWKEKYQTEIATRAMTTTKNERTKKIQSFAKSGAKNPLNVNKRVRKRRSRALSVYSVLMLCVCVYMCVAKSKQCRHTKCKQQKGIVCVHNGGKKLTEKCQAKKKINTQRAATAAGTKKANRKIMD